MRSFAARASDREDAAMGPLRCRSKPARKKSCPSVVFYCQKDRGNLPGFAHDGDQGNVLPAR